jgi:ADP-ribose pyrophosphatase
VTTAAPTSPASRRARRKDEVDPRETIWSIRYPTSRSETANAPARFPAPTIVMVGFPDCFADMPGRIAECRKPNPVLYIVVMPKRPRSKSKPVKSSKAAHGKARLISSRTVYRGPVFWVTTDDVEEPGGVRAHRDVIHHTGSVVILAVDESRSTTLVLLERQYRHAAKGFLWELPAGRIDPGERALHAAKRELLEETGYAAANWRRILNFYASPGFVAETMSVYLATGLKAGPAHPEADEVIQMRFVSLSAALRMVLKGTIRDAKTISSVLWLDHTIREK